MLFTRVTGSAEFSLKTAKDEDEFVKKVVPTGLWHSTKLYARGTEENQDIITARNSNYEYS